VNRRLLLAWMLAVVAAIGCGLDSRLTCGEACAGEDATVDSRGQDSNVPDSPWMDASSDVAPQQDGSCVGRNCGDNSDCCMGAPYCSGAHQCVVSCSGADGGCSSSSGCCKGLFCQGGTVCTQCYPFDASCSQDFECCTGNCNGTFDAGSHCGF